MADDLTLSDAARRHITAMAVEVGTRVKDVVGKDLEEAVSKRQKTVGELDAAAKAAEARRQSAEHLSAELDRSNEAKRRRRGTR